MTAPLRTARCSSNGVREVEGATRRLALDSIQQQEGSCMDADGCVEDAHGAAGGHRVTRALQPLVEVLRATSRVATRAQTMSAIAAIQGTTMEFVIRNPNGRDFNRALGRRRHDVTIDRTGHATAPQSRHAAPPSANIPNACAGPLAAARRTHRMPRRPLARVAGSEPRLQPFVATPLSAAGRDAMRLDSGKSRRHRGGRILSETT
jgi:hypothetical protein